MDTDTSSQYDEMPECNCLDQEGPNSKFVSLYFKNLQERRFYLCGLTSRFYNKIQLVFDRLTIYETHKEIDTMYDCFLHDARSRSGISDNMFEEILLVEELKPTNVMEDSLQDFAVIIEEVQCALYFTSEFSFALNQIILDNEGFVETDTAPYIFVKEGTKVLYKMTIAGKKTLEIIYSNFRSFLGDAFYENNPPRIGKYEDFFDENDHIFMSSVDMIEYLVCLACDTSIRATLAIACLLIKVYSQCKVHSDPLHDIIKTAAMEYTAAHHNLKLNLENQNSWIEMMTEHDAKLAADKRPPPDYSPEGKLKRNMSIDIDKAMKKFADVMDVSKKCFEQFSKESDENEKLDHVLKLLQLQETAVESVAQISRHLDIQSGLLKVLKKKYAAPELTDETTATLLNNENASNDKDRFPSESKHTLDDCESIQSTEFFSDGSEVEKQNTASGMEGPNENGVYFWLGHDDNQNGHDSGEEGTEISQEKEEEQFQKVIHRSLMKEIRPELQRRRDQSQNWEQQALKRDYGDVPDEAFEDKPVPPTLSSNLRMLLNISKSRENAKDKKASKSESSIKGNLTKGNIEFEEGAAGISTDEIYAEEKSRTPWACNFDFKSELASKLAPRKLEDEETFE